MSFKQQILFLLYIALASSGLSAQESSKAALVKHGEALLAQSEEWFYENLDSFYHYQIEASLLFEKAEDWENYVNCLSSAAYYFHTKGDFDNFEAEALKAIAISEKHLGEDSEAYSIALNNLSVFLNRKGNYSEAIEGYLRVIPIMQKHYPDDSEGLATTYHNLSVVYRNMGDYDAAIRYLEKAEKLLLSSEESDQYPTARTFLAQGNIYRDKRDYTRALGLYQRFLQIVRQPGFQHTKNATRDLLYCYQSMAKSHLQLEHSDSIRHFIQKALQMHPQSDQRRQVLTFEILGDAHLAKQEYAEAITAYQQATELSLAGFASFDKHKTKARTFSKLAQAYLDAQNTSAALDHFQQALVHLAFDFEDLKSSSNPRLNQLLSKNEALPILLGKAQAFFQRYTENGKREDAEMALGNYTLATQLIQELRQSFLAQGSKELLAEKALPVFEGGIDCALALHRLSQDKQYLHQAFAFAEQNKAQLLLESLQEEEARFGGAIPEAELNKERQLSIDLAFYEKQINLEKRKKENANVEKLGNWQNRLFDLQREYQELVGYFEQHYPRYYELKYNTRFADAQSLREKIVTSKSALLEYFVGTEKAYLFVLSEEKLSVWPLNQFAALKPDLRTLQGIISQAPQPERFLADCKNFGEAAWALGQELMVPALQALPASVQQLIIVPDDVLAYLPFEILLEEAGPEQPKDFYENTFAYLQNRYAISYSYSATLLENHFESPYKNYAADFLGFAPSFEEVIAGSTRSCDGSLLSSLHCNQQEVENIGQLFDGQTYLAASAKRQAFYTEAAQHRIIHLATHACAGESDWTDNRIHFADDFISNRDLHHMELGAELAVLSACNTGSGQLVKGEGVMSLSRGFIVAGCPSTLMSLWSVDDCTTSDIMLHFYQNLLSGKSKNEALRQAKLLHLQKADKALAHPYYWAAFVQFGNAEAMQFSNGLAWLWWLVLPGVFLLWFFLGRRFI